MRRIGPGPAERLAALVRCRTVSDPDEFDAGEFTRFRDVLAAAYPLMHTRLELTIYPDGTLLWKWPGRSASRPMVLMAHHDVVPAPSEGWSRDPFAGDILDGRVWGRGTLDDKGALVCLVEAVEEALEDGVVPAHDVWVLSGADEEIEGHGARRAADDLRVGGVRPWLVCDEGGAIVPDEVADGGPVLGLVGIAEKGTVDVDLIAHGHGGHSSMPEPEGAVLRLARAVVAVEEAEVDDTAAPELAALAEPLAALGPVARTGARTTMAVTRLAGSPGDNVLATRARAHVNVRLAPGDDRRALRSRLEDLVGPHAVEVESLHGDDPSRVAPAHGAAWQHLCSAARSGDERVEVAPYVMPGSTDARFFASWCDAVYRYLPLEMDAAQRRSLHGIDEQVSIDSLLRGIGFYRSLVRGQW